MFTVVGEHIFPFLRDDLPRQLGSVNSTYAHHMRDARFTIPAPALLARVVDMLDHVPMEDRDIKGDVYEYMLGKIATAGQNGQFRTPRHIIRLMVEITAPHHTDVICDPACGTAGFLIEAGEYLREHNPTLLHEVTRRKHFHHNMFHGFEFDNTMLRIGSMNMLLHGVENPDIRYRDSLAQDHASEEEKYTLVLANPPFAGSLDYENTAKDLLQIVKTKKTELLFLALCIRLLKPGWASCVDRSRWRPFRLEQSAQGAAPHPGRRPEARCYRSASRRCVQTLRWCLHRDSRLYQDQLRWHRLRLVLRRHSRWMESRRQANALMSEDKLGAVPRTALRTAEHANNNLPDVLARWAERTGSEGERPRTAQSFRVPKHDIAAHGYDLSINRYKEVVHEAIAHRAPKEILTELVKIGKEIQRGIKELEGMLG